MSMFSDENIMNFLINEKYNLSGYICILQYVQMTSNSNLQIITLLCNYADELLELVEFIEYCFPNISILTLEELNDIIKIIVDRGLFSKMTYEIIDNVYIKIKCS